MKKEKKTSFRLRDRFRYWFDNRMTKGSLGFIRVLIIASILLALLIAGLIILFHFNEEGEVASVFWDSIATVINAWMPSFEDGSPGYVILMAITAIAGVLFTSVLIGIITSAIEEKIDNLKRGNSLVLEKDHIVVLGFNPGEYTLLEQLILASGGKPDCIVVAEDMDREEMEQAIEENLEIPKNFRIVCRTADITDPAALEKCSVETSRTIIVNPTDDMRTIKAVLAVSTLLDEKGVPEISVNAIISKEHFRIPPSIAETNHISTLQTESIMAKMIAHSCTQTGLSDTFKELFNFEGSEFYLISLPGTEGLSFEDLSLRLDQAVPAGVVREGKVFMNPEADFQIRETDKILVFSEESDSAALRRMEAEEMPEELEIRIADNDEVKDTVIVGYNETLPVILRELPENVSVVTLVSHRLPEEQEEELQKIAGERNLKLNHRQLNLRSEKGLLELARSAGHIVMLSDHDKDPEEADMQEILLLMNLRDIRKRFDLHFNIAVEMQKEHNQKLVGRGDHTDFLVSSNMASLILAQIAESPELMEVFKEILSNKGNELYLKNCGSMGLSGNFGVRSLRYNMLKKGYILLGYLDAEKISHFNSPLFEQLTLTEEDYLIVIGKD
ncbi:MAG: hypothetical protein J6Y95_00965 [Lachnospiraceae bacterium]|nr:hypothetical protein [Lachnospiraceae bacterium]